MSCRNGANHLCCPRCGGDLVAVNDSRPGLKDGEPIVKRARSCNKCKRNSNTVEITEASLDKIFVDLASASDDAKKRVNAAMMALKMFVEAGKP